MNLVAMLYQELRGISDIHMPRLAPASITQALGHTLIKL